MMVFLLAYIGLGGQIATEQRELTGKRDDRPYEALKT
jgi:hypothetical protein